MYFNIFEAEMSIAIAGKPENFYLIGNAIPSHNFLPWQLTTN
jgi:hypothetical protein